MEIFTQFLSYLFSLKQYSLQILSALALLSKYNVLREPNIRIPFI